MARAVVISPEMALLLRLTEAAEFWGRLVLPCRHQVAVGAQEIEFLADDDVIVVLTALFLIPEDIALAMEGLHHHPGCGQCMVDRRDLVPQDVVVGFVEGNALLDDALIITVQRKPAGIDDPGDL